MYTYIHVSSKGSLTNSLIWFLHLSTWPFHFVTCRTKQDTSHIRTHMYIHVHVHVYTSPDYQNAWMWHKMCTCTWTIMYVRIYMYVHVHRTLQYTKEKQMKDISIFSPDLPLKGCTTSIDRVLSSPQKKILYTTLCMYVHIIMYMYMNTCTLVFLTQQPQWLDYTSVQWICTYVRV